MRNALAAAYAAVRVDRAWLLASAFYVPATALLGWALLVMLRSRLPEHADGLWTLAFAHDVLNGIPLGGWVLPGAPIHFPEVSSLVVLGGLGFGPRSSLLIYGACSWLLLAGGVYWGLHLRGLGTARAFRGSFCALLIYLLLHFGSKFAQVFEFPFSHGGALLVGYCGLLYLGHGLERGFGLRGWFSALLVLSLSCASDRVILGQFVAPALSVLFGLFVLRVAPRRPLLWAMGLLLAAPLLGWLMTLLIRFGGGLAAGSYHPHYGWAASARTMSRVLDDLGRFFMERPVLALSVLLPVLFLTWRAFVLLRDKLRDQRSGQSEELSITAECWLACAAPACFVATIGAVVVTNVWSGMVSQRYLLPIFILPPALGIVVGMPARLRFTGNVLRVFETSLLFLLVLFSARAAARTPRRVAMLDDPRRTCLDSLFKEEKLRAGYANYWLARAPMVLGNAGITLAEVKQRLEPRSWADNRFWYTRGYWPAAEPPRFSFAIANKLDEPWIGARFGPPRAERDCFGLRVWIYDRPEDVEFRNYLRGSNALVTGDNEGWWPLVGKGAERTGGPNELAFQGKKGVLLKLPRVAANVIEIASSTGKPIYLSYRREGAEVSRQEVSFEHDRRRLLTLPAGLDLRTVDAVFVSGEAKPRYRVTRIALMWDAEVESARR